LSNCLILDDWGEEPPRHPNCPNCGRFLKWCPASGFYWCGCNGILYHYTTGDAEWDKENIEEGIELPMAICKKPKGWKDEWGQFLLPEYLSCTERKVEE
jgi:hypothetical protein